MVSLFFQWVSLQSSRSQEDKSGAILLPFTGVGASYAVTDKLELEVIYQGAIFALFNAGMLGGGIVYPDFESYVT